jgi:hemerythrin-like metal-binding protein
MLMKWSDTLATRVPEFDRQYQLLFEMTEQFRETIDREARGRTFVSMLDAVEAFAAYAFTTEESRMADCGCASPNNPMAHEMLMSIIAASRHRHELIGYSVVDAHAFLDSLEQWLVSQVRRLDRQLESCCDPEIVAVRRRA